jgi:hypothetical protein
LAIAAGALGPRLFKRRDSERKNWLTWAAILLIVMSGDYAAAGSWAYPLSIAELPAAMLISRADPLDAFPEHVQLATKLNQTHRESAAILTDDFYLIVALQRQSGLKPVPIWSPEVSFIFDRKVPPPEARRRLLANGIELISVGRGSRSVNNKYLLRQPFYREDILNWKPVELFPTLATVYSLAGDTTCAGN